MLFRGRLISEGAAEHSARGVDTGVGMYGWWKVKKSRKDAEMPKSGVGAGMAWFSPKFLKTLEKQFEAVKPETWHKLMNPMCGEYLAERGRNPKNFRVKWVSGQNTPLGADVESAN